jgi:hypothetical protein
VKRHSSLLNRPTQPNRASGVAFKTVHTEKSQKKSILVSICDIVSGGAGPAQPVAKPAHNFLEKVYDRMVPGNSCHCRTAAVGGRICEPVDWLKKPE